MSKIILNDANLSKYGWLFSASLGLMVREHEAGRGRWDVEVDHYKNVNTPSDPVWEPDTDCSYPPYETLADALNDNEDIRRASDWIPGDKVNFF